MEKFGKVWRREHETAARHEAQDGVYSIPADGGAIAMRACSACAGDYEDPDRTAWTPDDEEDEESDGGARVTTEEFPAEK